MKRLVHILKYKPPLQALLHVGELRTQTNWTLIPVMGLRAQGLKGMCKQAMK